MSPQFSYFQLVCPIMCQIYDNSLKIVWLDLPAPSQSEAVIKGDCKYKKPSSWKNLWVANARAERTRDTAEIVFVLARRWAIDRRNSTNKRVRGECQNQGWKTWWTRTRLAREQKGDQQSRDMRVIEILMHNNNCC